MLIDTRPTDSVTFLKNFDEPINVHAENYVLKISTFIKNDS